jgi:phospholipase A-2-activating protein
MTEEQLVKLPHVDKMRKYLNNTALHKGKK